MVVVISTYGTIAEIMPSEAKKHNPKEQSLKSIKQKCSSKQPKEKLYTPEDLSEVLRLIRCGELSQRRASKQFKIPVMTLSDHMNKKVSYVGV